MYYIGSKKSLIGFLKETILQAIGYNVDNKVFADLFSGTGVVASSFKELGFEVIANDLQHYSYVMNKFQIENNEPLDSEWFWHMNRLKGVEGFIYNNYCAGSGSGRSYFADENGKKCDAIRQEIEKLKSENKINDGTYYGLLSSLIESVDKCANTTSVYVAFLKKIKKSAEREFVFELLPNIVGKNLGKVYNEDANELITKISGDILYLDPPYNERQYSSNYHVLETISRYDNPILHGLTGMRDYENQKSEFCYKQLAPKALEEIIKNAQFKYIFMSYNNDGIMPLDVIENVMKKYGEYAVVTKDYKRYKADNDRNNKSDLLQEYIHCLIKK